jgi:cyclic pyranopterin phosphate synthase
MPRKPPRLSHVDEAGAAHMVDVGAKEATARCAVAQAEVRMGQAARAALHGNAKGDCFAAARIAGITAAKRTWELIPLCHALALSHVAVELTERPWGVRVITTARTVAATGVEMEALTAAAVAALTLYDMLKAVDKAITIEGVRLLEKTGGKSGPYRRKIRSRTPT